mmetsp:Transcript_60836/g.148980  ORF Transcript_60836/g.148980 Transcript_60836/m.148980 type:complete len:104 (+) Transcript_60836:393-704(+)
MISASAFTRASKSFFTVALAGGATMGAFDTTFNGSGLQRSSFGLSSSSLCSATTTPTITIQAPAVVTAQSPRYMATSFGRTNKVVTIRRYGSGLSGSRPHNRM